MGRIKQTARKSTGSTGPRYHAAHFEDIESSLAPHLAVSQAFVKETVSSGQPKEKAKKGQATAPADGYRTASSFTEKIGTLLQTSFDGDSAGTFAASAELPDAPNPGLEIEGLGSIGMPLSHHDAQRLIEVCEQAPFGKKNKTVVDLSVRRTWQLDSSKVRFRNPAWTAFLTSKVLSEVGVKLGVPAAFTQVHLYKLLLYSEGGHFDKHQDTEKEAGMFGTLVIILPSLFTGGQVTVSHGDREMTFDTADGSEFGLYFTCLYTDVFHKIHPVTSGYRLALSYNLVHNAGSVPLPRAPNPNGSAHEIRGVLEAWLGRIAQGREEETPEFFAHLLEHQYSEVGLDFRLLKGSDQAKVEILKELAADLGFSIYLAQLDMHITGPGVDTGGYGGGRGWGSYSDEDDEEDHEPDESEMIEITEQDYTLKAAVGPDGSSLNLEHFEISDEDFAPQLDLEKLRPDEVESEGYQGNYAGDVQHWYFRTAILLWPKATHAGIAIRGIGVDSVIRLLGKKVNSYLSRPTNAGSAHQELSRLAHAMTASKECIPTLTKAAIALKDGQLFDKVARHDCSLEGSLWVDAIRTFGFASVRVILDNVLNQVHADENLSTQCARRTVEHYLLLTDIQLAFSNDQAIAAWADEQCMRVLASSTHVDTGVVSAAVSFAQRLGFDKCRAMLETLLTRISRDRAISLANGPSRSAIKVRDPGSELIKTVRERFRADEAAQGWSDDRMLELLTSPLPSLGEEVIEEAKTLLAHMGFKKCQEMLEALLSTSGNDPSNAHHNMLVNQLRETFADDRDLQIWLAERRQQLLLSCKHIDAGVIDNAVDLARLIGFARSKAMLGHLLNTAQANKTVLQHRDPYYYRLSRTPYTEHSDYALDLLSRVFELFPGDEAGSEWCKDNLLLLVGGRDDLTPKETPSLVRVVQVCYQQHRPDLLLDFLGKLERPTCSAAYLTGTIQPFANAARALLTQRSLSFKDAPVNGFAKHCLEGAIKLWVTASPPAPLDQSLPHVGHPEIDKFLRSSVQHVFRLPAVQSVRSAAEKALKALVRQGKVTCETERLRSPHTLVVRKTLGHALANPCTDDITPALRRDWEDSMVNCSGPCDMCHAIRACLLWSENTAKMKQFIEAFGRKAVRAVFADDPRLSHLLAAPTTKDAASKTASGSHPNRAPAAAVTSGEAALASKPEKGSKTTQAKANVHGTSKALLLAPDQPISDKPKVPKPATATATATARKRKAAEVIDLTDSPEKRRA